MAKTANLGFPRLGINREWKRATEKYWAGKIDLAELTRTADDLTSRHWQLQAESGIQIIPCNDFAFYDHMLDTAVMVGAVPPRYGFALDGEVDVDTYFSMARGRQDAMMDVVAMEMTKWFDTNYHYIVPEFYHGMRFRLSSQHPFRSVERARSAGVAQPRPVLVGPATFLLLGKVVGNGFCHLDLVEELTEVYAQVLTRLHEMSIPWVQIDEPSLVTDLDEKGREIFHRAYERLSSLSNRPRILLATYFGNLGNNLEVALKTGVERLHLDLLRAPDQLDEVLATIDSRLTLSLGVVDGRNVWRTDLDRALMILRRAADKIGTDRIEVAPSCSLLHCPMDLREEKNLDPEIKEWLAFGMQKLEEVSVLTEALNHGEETVSEAFEESRSALRRRRASERVIIPEVQRRLASITEDMFHRNSPSDQRRLIQKDKLNLPPLPTTTIGSFPQTQEIRKLRVDVKKGLISRQQADDVLRDQVIRTITFQEEVGIDVLVHGEFERNDMVEYFAEQLDGFAFTSDGWVQSYGSRAVKPPIIFGDVRRREPMTVSWTKFAQAQTSKPVKGLLTGPITLLEWSFVRNDQPKRLTCQQLALAVRDEVTDLERAGIEIIQIDEPALREGMPLRRQRWDEYLDWAVRCFRLASSGVCDETQIHTHMCYCEFNDVIESIAALDADVLSIEASRSRMELLDAFKRFDYPTEVGPGVWDIHSPRIPTTEEMIELLRKATQNIGWDKLWVNPDCGLKTRNWDEVVPALENMVAAARLLRKTLVKASKVA